MPRYKKVVETPAISEPASSNITVEPIEKVTKGCVSVTRAAKITLIFPQIMLLLF